MKKLFRCEFCNYESESEQMTKDHEERCLYNPVFKSCYSCEHFELLYNTLNMECNLKVDGLRYVRNSVRHINCEQWNKVPKKWDGILGRIR